MSRYKVSGESLRNFYKKPTLLWIVFRDIEHELKLCGQVVCRFILNGKILSDVDEVLASQEDLAFVDTLEYESESIDLVSREIVNQWIPVVQKMLLVIEKFSSCSLSDERRTRVQLKIQKNYFELVKTMYLLMRITEDSLLTSCPNWGEAIQLSESIRNMTNRNVSKNKDSEEINTTAQKEIIEFDINNSLQLWLDCLLYIQHAQIITADNRKVPGITH